MLETNIVVWKDYEGEPFHIRSIDEMVEDGWSKPHDKKLLLFL